MAPFDALTPQAPAQTVGELRAALSGLADDMPVFLDGGGLLAAVQPGEAGAGEAHRPAGFVDDPDANPVPVLWLIGEARDE